MCGILGGLGKHGLTPEKIIIGLNELSHRGPDGEGLLLDENHFFGHRRLSIIDLSGGAQPITSPDGRYSIIFNGEIYNYKEIKNLAGDYKYKTNSDTEVILALYIKYGEKVVDHLEGMFALSIYDAQKKSLFIARDHLGIKPLVYYCDGEKLIFASEIKAILPLLGKKLTFDKKSLYDFLALKFIPAPYTIYTEIKKLPAGSLLKAKLSGGKIELEEIKYWRPIYSGENTQPDIGKLKEIFLSQVKKHLIADVPVGAFLSGGIDSSAVVWGVKNAGVQPQTFTVNFSSVKNDPDVECSQLIAKKFSTDHHEIIVDDKDYLADSEKIFAYLDEPFADPAMLSNYYVSRATTDFIKVALSGDGGDEMFFGYQSYQNIGAKNSLLGRLLGGKNWEIKKHFGWQKILTDKLVGPGEPRIIFKRKSYDAITALRLIDLEYTLPDYYLAKTDYASMMNSLEVRVPFVNKLLAEEVLKIKTSAHFDAAQVGKNILKKITTNELPPEVINRAKKGFTRPTGVLLNEKNLKFIEEIAKKIPYLNKNIVQRMVAKNNNKSMLWRLLVLCKWFENYKKYLEI